MKKYLCGVAFCHELGETDDIGIYDTLEEVQALRCSRQCGIVEIEFADGGNPEDYTSHKWLQEQDLRWQDEDLEISDLQLDEPSLDPEASKESDQ